MAQRELIQEGLQIVHYFCVSSLSSFLTMEQHGLIQNTKFIIDRFTWRRESKAHDENGVSENVQTTLCCRVEKFLANVSMRHVFLLMLRELLLIDNKDKYTITSSAEVVTLIGLMVKQCSRMMEIGHSSEEILRSIEKFCDVCRTRIIVSESKFGKFEEKDGFLEEILNLSNENEMMKLAVHTLKKLKLDLDINSVSLLINNGTINTIKVMGGKKSRIVDGLVVIMKKNNLPINGKTGKCIIIEGALKDTSVISNFIQNEIGIVFCSGEVEDNLAIELGNNGIIFISEIDDNNLNKISDICGITPIPVLILEEMLTDDFTSQVNLESIIGLDYEEAIHHEGIVKYVAISNQNEEKSPVITCILNSNSSKVELLEEKYFECMVFLINSLNSRGYQKSKLHTLVYCLRDVESINIEAYLPDLNCCLRDVIWLGISSSGYDKSTCCKITDSIKDGYELDPQYLHLVNPTDTSSLLSLFEMILSTLKIYLKSDIVLVN